MYWALPNDEKGSITLLIDSLDKFIGALSEDLVTPKLMDQKKELEEQHKHYYIVMKNGISFAESSDLDYIPADKRALWKDYVKINLIAQKFPGAIKLTKEQNSEIGNIYHDIVKEIDMKLARLSDEIERTDESGKLDEIEYINKIKRQIEGDLIIDSNDFKTICGILSNLSVEEALSDEEEYEIYKALSFYLRRPHDLVDTSKIFGDSIDDEIVNENAILLSDEALRSVFSSYNYDYDLIHDEEKARLKKFGNLNNISEILDIISDYRIDVECFINGLPIVLAHSNPQIINEIISYIKEDCEGKNISEEWLLNKLLYFPNIFVKGTKTFRGNKSNNTSSSLEGLSGLFSNYKNNRQFFIEKGADVASIYRKTPHIFGDYHARIRNNYSILKSYDIPDALIFKTPTCLNAGDDIYSSLDFYVESECERHLINNLVHSLINTSRETKERILIVKKIGDEKDLYDPRHKHAQFAGYVSNMNDTRLYSDPRVQITSLKQVPMFLDEREYFENEEGRAIKQRLDEITANAIYNKDDELQDNPYIDYLDENLRYDYEQVYRSDNLVISRRKVIRLLNCLLKSEEVKNMGIDNKTILAYALTKDSILNSDQLRTAINVVDHVVGRGLVKDEGTN